MRQAVVLYRAPLSRRSQRRIDFSSVAPFALVVLEDVLVPRGIALCDRLARRLARFRQIERDLEE